MENLKWVHLVAIGGTGMGAMASMLQRLGWKVTGSDGPLYPPMSVFLESQKIPRTEHYSAENLQGKTWGFSEDHPELVIIGNAISRGHVEANYAEKLKSEGKCQIMSFAQALAEFCIQDRESYVVCGTHGKTSTSTQMAWALESLKQSPGFFIGGIPANFPQGCRMGEGNCFVSEGDEYDTAYWDKESKFLHYRPSWVLCTGIEFDHADIYANIEAIEKSFHKLIHKTKKAWVLIDEQSAPRADVIQRLQKALSEADCNYISYGRSEQSNYRLLSVDEELIDIENGIMGSVFVFQTPKWGVQKFQSSISGEHNALNTLGIMATLIESGRLKTPDEAQEYLKTFKSVKRRQEELFVSPDLIVIDDFAHHPTAIRETIKAIRKKYPKRKVAAFFEPRSATSGRNVFQDEFIEAFALADRVYLTPPTKTNIPQDQKLDVEKIADSLRGQAVQTTIDAQVNVLEDHFLNSLTETHEPAVALVMSNGAFSGLAQHLAQRGEALFPKSLGPRKGQTSVEYILLIFVIIVIVLGVFFPIIQRTFDGIQKDLAANTQSVVAQDQLGIPLSWFELQADDDIDIRFNALNSGLSGASNTPGTGATGNGMDSLNPAGAAGANAADSANAGGAGPDSLEDNQSGGQRNRSRGGSSSGSSSSGGAGQQSANNSSGANTSAEDGGARSNIVEQRSGSSMGSSGENFDSSMSGENTSSSGGGVAGSSDEEEAASAEELARRRATTTYDAREEAGAGGGCQDVDFGTLLKMIAIIGILLVGAIMAFTSRGGGKNAK